MHSAVPRLPKTKKKKKQNEEAGNGCWIKKTKQNKTKQKTQL